MAINSLTSRCGARTKAIIAASTSVSTPMSMLVIMVSMSFLVGCSAPGPVSPAVDAKPVISSRTVVTAPEQANEPSLVTGKPPQAVVSLLQRARQLQIQGQCDQAIVAAERGLSLDRRAPELYQLLSACYLDQGRAQSAAEFARQGLRYAPKYSEVAAQLQAIIDQVN